MPEAHINPTHRESYSPLTVGLGLVALGLSVRHVLRRSPAQLRGKVVLISGGSRGLGIALAQELLDEGCEVAITSRSEQELEAAKQQLMASRKEADQAKIATFRCDLTDTESIRALEADVTRHFGRIDILINDAGSIEVANVNALEIDDFEKAMKLMFFGHLHLTWAVLPQMSARKSGQVVNISSIGGRVSVPRLMPYCAAKFALTGFSEGLSVELRRKGINVLTVIPGLMRTGSHLQAEFKGDSAKEFDWFALGASSPFLADSAESAAKKIVAAMREGKDELVVGAPAKALSLIHGIAPSLVRTILTVADQVLPSPSSSKKISTGKDELPGKGWLFEAATALGRTAAAQFNQWSERKNERAAALHSA